MSPDATILTDGVFDIIVRLEIEKSLRLQYPVSLLAVRADAGRPLVEDSELIDRLARIIAVAVRSTDVIGRAAGSAILQVLLVDAHHEHLPGVIARIQEEVEQHRFPVGDDRVQALLRIGAASFPTTATTLEDLRAQALSGATA
jgi:PleD family two-component response regulator